MATTTRKRAAPQLSDEQLEELLGLVKRADTVELKLTVPAQDIRASVIALGLDPLDAQIRQVVFFDTPDLALNRAGVVARARRVQTRGGDTVVKLRPVVPDQLAEDLRRTPGFGVEVDAMPGGYVCSCSFKGTATNSGVLKAMRGKTRIRKLFSKGQRAFYAAHAPEGLDLDSLGVLGPIFVLKLNTVPKGFGRKLTTELWLYPDGARILELSTKCHPSEMLDVAAHSREFLLDRGVNLSGQQQAKTKSALEFFTR